MISFKQYLEEGINDKGLFKAVFMAGLPGSGKSYTVKRINDGAVEPRVVNVDKFVEFLGSGKAGQNKEFRDNAKRLTKNELVNFLNGMLPLFVDGTSKDIANTSQRAGILEFFGYDTAMIWVNTDLETSLRRAAKRKRVVDPEFIIMVNKIAEKNKQFFKNKFSFFLEINNGDGELTNEVITKAGKKMSKFFLGELRNPVGIERLEKMRELKEKFLIPNIVSKEEIEKRVDIWFRK